MSKRDAIAPRARLRGIPAAFILASLSLCASGQNPPPGTPSRHDPPDRVYDLEDVTLRLTIDPAAGTIRGIASNRLRPLGTEPLSMIPFFADEMTIDGAAIAFADGSRSPATFERHGQKLEVRPARKIESGGAVTVDISYHLTHPRRGAFFVLPDASRPNRVPQFWTQGEMEDTRYWIPTWDYPNEKATSETYVTVPPGWVVAANGEAVGKTDAAPGGWTTWHHRMTIPHSTYLISVVAGEFDIRALDDAKIDGSRTVPLRVLAPRSEGSDARLETQRVPKMIEFYSRRLGFPYPWPKYDQTFVTDFTWGGMENVTTTTLSEEHLRDPALLADDDEDGLLAHELAHQWFGDWVSFRDWSGAWISEGWASYAGNLWKEERDGIEEFDLRRRTDREGYFAEAKDKGERPIVSSRWTDADDLFDSHTYRKGAAVIHSLRKMLGDEPFFRAVRHHLERNGGKAIAPRDVADAFVESTGQELGWFFEQWLDRAGHPKLEASWDWNEATGRARIHVKQSSTSPGGELYRLKTSVALLGPDGKVLVESPIEISLADERFEIPSPRRPSAVLVDPDRSLPAELRNARTVEELGLVARNSPFSQARLDALEDLVSIPGAEAASTIAAALSSDRSRTLREAAAGLAGKRGGGEAKSALVRALSNDSEMRVRAAAADALSKFFGEKDVAAALGARFESETSPTVRSSILTAAGRLGGDRAFDLLKRGVATGGRLDKVAEGGYAGLALLGDDRAIPIALAGTSLSRGLRERVAATAALEKLGHDDKRVSRRLRELLGDPAMPVRKRAVEALGERHDKDAEEKIAIASEMEPFSRFRVSARAALAKIRGTSASSPPDRRVSDLELEVERLRSRMGDLEKGK